MKLVEKLIEVRLLSDGFFFGVLYLHFGPAADQHAEDDLGYENRDKGDRIGIKLELSAHFSHTSFFSSRLLSWGGISQHEWTGSSTGHQALVVDSAGHEGGNLWSLAHLVLGCIKLDWHITVASGYAIHLVKKIPLGGALLEALRLTVEVLDHCHQLALESLSDISDGSLTGHD
jgi:hypothetical protein